MQEAGCFAVLLTCQQCWSTLLCPAYALLLGFQTCAAPQWQPSCLQAGRPFCISTMQALVLEAEEKLEAQAGGERSALAAAATTFYEVTIASIDQPKLLSRLSESLVRRRKGALQRNTGVCAEQLCCAVWFKVSCQHAQSVAWRTVVAIKAPAPQAVLPANTSARACLACLGACRATWG